MLLSGPAFDILFYLSNFGGAFVLDFMLNSEIDTVKCDLVLNVHSPTNAG